MRKYLAAALVILLFVTALPGCSESASSPQNQSGGDGNLRVLVSDEPNDIGDFYSVNVTISKLGVQVEGSDNFTDYDIDPPMTVDLTKLVGDNASEVWDGQIASGNYTKIFIYVDNVTGILKGEDGLSGDNTTVKLPGGKLQISRPFGVEPDGTVDFVFDITVIKAGNSGKYILKPQIAESGPTQPFVDVTPTTAQENKKGPEGKGEGQNPEVPKGSAPDTVGDQPGKGRK